MAAVGQARITSSPLEDDLVTTFSIKSLPKFSVRVGVPDPVHLVDHVNHHVDV